mmetsp:Transcript_50086/g.112786  ORF Transcript_50086/g.112786 Transcript_50086/m.112786 type:complete len:104 (-) Transcript_50086:124-435(-)
MPSPEPPCCIWVECQIGLIACFVGALTLAAGALLFLLRSFVGSMYYVEFCVFLFFLGFTLSVIGLLYECLGCGPSGRWHNKKVASDHVAVARECAQPYTLITD